MSDEKQLRDDLHYVRAVVDRAERVDNPASTYFVWAAITFVGYAIIDFEPEATGRYWMVAGPLGGVLTGALGALNARRAGQVSHRGLRAEALHWIGLYAAILLLVPLEAAQRIAAMDLPRLILLLVALTYWTAGVHLDRRLLPVGGMMAALYALTVFAPALPYLWTITASGLAASLVAAGLLAASRARRTAGSSV
jgi:hypothetical protein